jgi:two-component system response regulator (stage 0 sporulation protein F)
LAADEPMETTSGGSPSVHVLFVDDDASLREVYRIRLERRGYRVRIAESADDAVRAVREERPDVIVLDIAMPERDGLSALQEFLDMDPTLPVIIHTAFPAYADNFLAWAADAYVVKAPDLGGLLEAIEKAAGISREQG